MYTNLISFNFSVTVSCCLEYIVTAMLSFLDAEDPDLDALLADLCQLEEDTKAQLATSKTTNSEEEDVVKPVR